MSEQVHTISPLAVPVGLHWHSSVFCRRLVWLTALLGAEWLPISSRISTGSGGQAIARGVSAFLALFVCFGYFRARQTFQAFARGRDPIPFSAQFLVLHALAMAAFLAFSLKLMAPGAGHSASLTLGWFVSGPCGIIFAALAFVPARVWASLLRATGNLFAYLLPASIVTACLASVLWSVWNRASWSGVTSVTFGLVEFVLRRLRPDIIADRTTLSIGNSHFLVRIGEPCSGLEGAGLILAFGVLWLWLFRRECRFPHALVVIPAGMLAMFASNVIRIVTLILIGIAGAPGIALGGFHSQAGWIAFNCIALILAFAAPRVAWIRVRTGAGRAAAASSSLNPSVPYLLPFAAILAAGLLSRAASGEFEWLYPLRFVAAIAALWVGRRTYSKLNWRPDWMAPLAGVAVFVLWIAMDSGPRHGPAGALVAQPFLVRALWVGFRALAATTTVPVAEELAFRGFLLRRLVSADFEAVDFRRVTYFSVALSSVLFGLMHGERWLAGAVAGIVYAMVARRRQSIGNAVLAHAITNALIAVSVLAAGNWQLW
jgi:exosortase E/protease (VPEID-CTERM system)